MDSRGDRSTEQYRKIFIGGLTSAVNEEMLDQHFSQFGELVDKIVMKDRMNGRSRGFGFITYKDAESVDLAQESRPHVLDNKVVETKRALPRDDSNREDNSVKVEKLFVGGLNLDVTHEHLKEYFRQYGEVVASEVATFRDSGKSRGFGFVTFKDYDPVDKCIIYKPHHINGSQSDVKKALSKEQIAQQTAQQHQSESQMGGYGPGPSGPYGPPEGAYGPPSGPYGPPGGGGYGPGPSGPYGPPGGGAYGPSSAPYGPPGGGSYGPPNGPYGHPAGGSYGPPNGPYGPPAGGAYGPPSGPYGGRPGNGYSGPVGYGLPADSGGMNNGFGSYGGHQGYGGPMKPSGYGPPRQSPYPSGPPRGVMANGRGFRGGGHGRGGMWT